MVVYKYNGQAVGIGGVQSGQILRLVRETSE